MKKPICIVSFFTAISILVQSCNSCSKEENPKIENGGIHFETPTNLESIAAIANPDRGFHLESIYFVDSLYHPWSKEKYPDGYITDREVEFDATDGHTTLHQQYFYLTNYTKIDIPQTAFDTMQLLFDKAKEKGYKFILRFAYDHNKGVTGVNTQDVLRHIEQLKPFIEKNASLIFTWQAGFIGTWGEWHNTPILDNHENIDAIIKAIVDALPDEKHVGIRYVNRKTALNLSDEYKARLGYHNDYFTAGEHPRALDNDYVQGTTDYEQVALESPYVITTGEIPYDGDPGGWNLDFLINVENSLKILRDHHYVSLDITQNYEKNLTHWKTYKISAPVLAKMNILFHPSYFLNDDGKPVFRSAYSFVRDHLGYRLYVNDSALELKIDAGQLSYTVPIQNYGFSTVFNPREVHLVLIDNEDQIVFDKKLEDKPKDWQPYDPEIKNYKVLTHQIEGIVSPGLTGVYKVGLWLPDPDERLQTNNRYDIKFAGKNIEIWENADKSKAINILGRVSF